MNKNKTAEALAMNLEPNPAQEARDMLFYVAEQGTAHDVEVFYKGLDVDKRVAFIENERDLSHLPDSIAKALLNDKNLGVQKALKRRKDFFIHTAVAGASENWAEEIRGLLFYAIEIGMEHDVNKLYKGFDLDKRVAFIKNEKDLSHLPQSIAKALLEDEDREVQEALSKRDDFFEHTAVAASSGNWESIYGLTKEQIIKKGRSCLAGISSLLSHNDRPFRDDELEAIKAMARDFDDPGVIESIMPFAEKSPKVARELVDNPAINSAYLKKLIDISLEKVKKDSVWRTLPIEIVLYHSDKLDEETIDRIRKTPELEHLFKVLEPPDKPIQDDTVNRNHAGKSKRQKKIIARKEKRSLEKPPRWVSGEPDETDEAWLKEA